MNQQVVIVVVVVLVLLAVIVVGFVASRKRRTIGTLGNGHFFPRTHAEIFAEERTNLEHHWDRGDNISTEDCA